MDQSRPYAPLVITASPDITDRTRNKLIGILFASAGLTRTGYIAAVTVATLVADELLESATLTGLPSAVGTIGIALGTAPIAWVMGRTGRRLGMVGGLSISALGAVLAAAAVQVESFPLFVVGMFLFGFGAAADRLARYAAGDVVPVHRQAFAISLVVWAGTIGSVAGPALLEFAQNRAISSDLNGLAGPYLLAALAILVAIGIVWIGLRPDPLSFVRSAEPGPKGTARVGGWLRHPKVFAAVVSLATGQVVMVLIMTMTPLHIRRAGEGLGIVGLVIAGHTFGMFALSPVTGWLGDRIGRVPVVVAGQILLVTSALMASLAAGDDREVLLASLFLLGLGWNFGFVAGSALLTEDVPGEARVGLQGFADTLTWVSGAAASLSSGFLLEWGSYRVLTLIGASLVLAVVWPWARYRTAVLAPT